MSNIVPLRPEQFTKVEEPTTEPEPVVEVTEEELPPRLPRLYIFPEFERPWWRDFPHIFMGTLTHYGALEGLPHGRRGSFWEEIRPTMHASGIFFILCGLAVLGLAFIIGRW